MIDPQQLRSLPELLEIRKKSSKIKLPERFENGEEWKIILALVRQNITFLFQKHEKVIKQYMIVCHQFFHPKKESPENQFTPEERQKFLESCEKLLIFRDQFLELLFLLTLAHEILSSHPDPLALGDRAHLGEIQESYQKLKSLDLYLRGDQRFIETLKEILDQGEKGSLPK